MRNSKVVFYAAVGLQILILYVIQDTPNLFPEIFGSKPLFLLPLALSVAVIADETPSTIVGAVCGAFTDLGSSGNIGFFAVSLTVVCFLISYAFRNRLLLRFITAFMLSALAIAVVICLYFLFFFVFKGIEDCFVYFVNHYISRIVITSFIFVPLWFLNGFLHRNLCD